MIKTYILGNPRSGTSLFRLMLNQHNNVIAPPESGFAHWWYSKYRDWTGSDNLAVGKVEAFVNDLSTSKKIESWGMDYKYLIELIQKEQPESYSALTSLVYAAYIRERNVKVIADKNNYYINHLNELPLIWPDARYIHIVRDGRDVACSYLDVAQLATTSPYKPHLKSVVGEIAKEWRINNSNILAFGKQLESPMLTIRFEDLIQSSEETLKKVCVFLEIPYQEEMLQYHEQELAQLIEPLITLDWKIKTKDKPDLTRIGRYRTDLTKEQIDSFNIEAAEMIRFFNYD